MTPPLVSVPSAPSIPTLGMGGMIVLAICLDEAIQIIFKTV